MSNLMYAGWARLKKEKIFWCLMLLMIVSALLMCMDRYQSRYSNGSRSPRRARPRGKRIGRT